MAERTAYMFGSKGLTSQMSQESETERKALTSASKNIKDNLPKWVKDGNVTEFDSAQETVKSARKALNDKNAPFRVKIAPLRKGMRYIDVVTVPDSIKELATVVSDEDTKKRLVVAPAFKLSEWCQKVVETKKKKD